MLNEENASDECYFLSAFNICWKVLWGKIKVTQVFQWCSHGNLPNQQNSLTSAMSSSYALKPLLMQRVNWLTWCCCSPAHLQLCPQPLSSSSLKKMKFTDDPKACIKLFQLVATVWASWWIGSRTPPLAIGKAQLTTRQLPHGYSWSIRVSRRWSGWRLTGLQRSTTDTLASVAHQDWPHLYLYEQLKDCCLFLTSSQARVLKCSCCSLADWVGPGVEFAGGWQGT